MGSFFSAIAALPALIKSLMELIGWLEVKLGPNWVEKVALIDETVEKLKVAKTEQEHIDAAKALSSILNGR